VEILFPKGGYEMRKFLLMVLLAISMFSVTGCGNDGPPEEDEQLEDVEEEDEIGDGEIDDE
jgi:predicted small lipoprotein YifL